MNNKVNMKAYKAFELDGDKKQVMCMTADGEYTREDLKGLTVSQLATKYMKDNGLSMSSKDREI